MAEFLRNRPEYNGKPGYEGYLNFRVASAAEILQDAGYFTCLSGKWYEHPFFFIDRGPEPPGFPWRSYAPGIFHKTIINLES